MDRLWHYTCGHNFDAIRDDGFLRPGLDGLVWLTDLHPAPRLALGLTSYMLSCDRMEHVFPVLPTPDVVRWVDYPLRDRLKELPGTMPMHWWVSERRVQLGNYQADTSVSVEVESCPKCWPQGLVCTHLSRGDGRR